MKNKEIAPSVLRQLDLLSNYYEIDKDKKIITISLHYDDINEIINTDYVNNKLPCFKDELLQKISEIIDSFPHGYKVDTVLDITNLRGYKLKDVMQALEDSLEVFHYTSHRAKSKSFLLAMILMGVGIISLFLMVLFNNHVEIEEPGFKDMISEIIDIIAWVFIWESVTLIALEPNQYNAVSLKLITRLNLITITSKKNKVSVNAHELITNFVQYNAKHKAGDTLLLVSGIALMSIALPAYIRNIINIAKGYSGYGTGTMFILNVIFLTLYTLASITFGVISVISYISQKKKYLRICNVLVPFLLLLGLVFVIGVSIVISKGTINYIEIIPFAFSSALTILAFIGWIFKLLTFYKK